MTKDTTIYDQFGNQTAKQQPFDQQSKALPSELLEKTIMKSLHEDARTHCQFANQIGSK